MMTEALAPTPLDPLQTPCLLLDEQQMMRNIRRLRERLLPQGVSFRPHLKTAKSIEVARRMMSTARGPATVSTLREAEFFGEQGVLDLLYAVCMTPGKIDRVVAIRNRGIDLSIVVDSLEVARAIAAASQRCMSAMPVLIEVDCGDHRGGLSPTEPELLVEIGRALEHGGARLRGVMTHAGQSYACRQRADIVAIAERERQVAVQSADILRAAGLPCEVVSVGSSPTALFAEDLKGVTEVRAGVFVFFDLFMTGLGVCSTSDIALSVLSTVIGVQPGQGTLTVDAGWMAMSGDRGTAKQSVDQGYGVVCNRNGSPYPDLLMIDANQEHGIVGPRPGSHSGLPPLKVGDLVRILPNHACATAGQHDAYRVLNENATAVTAVWPRIRGW